MLILSKAILLSCSGIASNLFTFVFAFVWLSIDAKIAKKQRQIMVKTMIKAKRLSGVAKMF